jgi:hypothetical protein
MDQDNAHTSHGSLIMIRKLKVLGILLAIPTIGYVALGLVASKQEREWHQALAQNVKNVPVDRLNNYDLHMACSDPALAPKLEDVCSPYSNVTNIQAVALWASPARTPKKNTEH